MTNTHLIIILRNYRRQIEDAIDRVREIVPVDAPRYVVKNLGGDVIKTQDYIALDPLHELIRRIDQDIYTLRGEPNDE